MADNRFTNLPRALERMRKIPVQVRVEVRDGLDAQAAYLVERIRPHVPRDHGDLADSLEWRRSPKPDKLRVIVTEGRTGDTSKERKARGVEFGHIDARSGTEVPAQPHFYPVYRSEKKKIRRALNAAARRAIRKAIT